MLITLIWSNELIVTILNPWSCTYHYPTNSGRGWSLSSFLVAWCWLVTNKNRGYMGNIHRSVFHGLSNNILINQLDDNPSAGIMWHIQHSSFHLVRSQSTSLHWSSWGAGFQTRTAELSILAYPVLKSLCKKDIYIIVFQKQSVHKRHMEVWSPWYPNTDGDSQLRDDEPSSRYRNCAS